MIRKPVSFILALLGRVRSQENRHIKTGEVPNINLALFTKRPVHTGSEFARLLVEKERMGLR